MPELTEAQLYDLGNSHHGCAPREALSAAIYLIEKLTKRVDRLQKKVQKLERRKK